MSEDLLELIEQTQKDKLNYYDNLLDKLDYNYLDIDNDIDLASYDYNDLLEKRNDIADTLGKDERYSLDFNSFSNDTTLSKIKHQLNFYEPLIFNYNGESAQELENNSQLNNILKINTTKHFCVQPNINGINISIQVNENSKIQFLTKNDGDYGLDVTHHFKDFKKFAALSHNMRYGDIIRGKLTLSLKYAKKHKIINPTNYILELLHKKEPQNLIEKGLFFIAEEYYSYTKRKLSVNAQLYELHNTFNLDIIEQEVICIFKNNDLAISLATKMDLTIKSDLEDSLDTKINGLLFKSMNTVDNDNLGIINAVFKPELYLTKFNYFINEKQEDDSIKTTVYFDEIYIDGVKVNMAIINNINELNNIQNWYKGMYIRVGLANNIVPKIYEYDIDYNKISIENRWQEWRKAHSQPFIESNGYLANLKNLTSVKNRIKSILINKCCFREVPTFLITNITMDCHNTYDFSSNAADYIIYTIDYIMNVNLEKNDLGIPLKKIIRKNRRAIKSLTVKRLIKVSYNDIINALKDNKLSYNLENVTKVINNDNYLKNNYDFLLPIYNELNKYMKQS